MCVEIMGMLLESYLDENLWRSRKSIPELPKTKLDRNRKEIPYFPDNVLPVGESLLESRGLMEKFDSGFTYMR